MWKIILCVSLFMFSWQVQSLLKHPDFTWNRAAGSINTGWKMYRCHIVNKTLSILVLKYFLLLFSYKIFVRMYQLWDHDIFRILFFNYDDGRSSVDKTQSEITTSFPQWNSIMRPCDFATRVRVSQKSLKKIPKSTKHRGRILTSKGIIKSTAGWHQQGFIVTLNDFAPYLKIVSLF